MKQSIKILSIFRSTTLRLTVWYLVVITILSLIFSTVIYNVATNEIKTRLNHYKSHLVESDDTRIRSIMFDIDFDNELTESSNNLLIELIYVNLFVFTLGGFISYLLAERSLMPIKRVHEAQSRFTSDTSHELKTPLAIMKAEIEVALRDKSASLKSLKEVLSSNLEEVNGLSKLTEMLLNLSRFDNNKIKLNLIDITKITQTAISKFDKKRRFTVSLPKKQFVYGNETAIFDLIKVLLDNAVQYSPVDSDIKIDIHKQDDNFIKFQITNLGVGISSKSLPHVFDRFYRADTSRTGGESKGYGLGLSLAKSIVDFHKGKIDIKSKLNQNTTVTFTLPTKPEILI